MGRKLAKQEGAALGDASVDAKYAAVMERGRRMEGVFDDISSSDFALAAWHLSADWIPKAQGKSYQIARKKVQVRYLPAEMQHLRSALRDIALGEKHYVLDGAKEEAKKVITDIERGVTKGWYSYLFHERMPGVTTKDHYYFSVRKLRDLVLEYLSWVLDDSKPVDKFPEALQAKIWWKIANRSGQTPLPGATLPSGEDAKFATEIPEKS
jgi:hypothetical protein